MTAARELAFWVKERADLMDSLGQDGRDALALADTILLHLPEDQPTKALVDRAFDMWMVMASSGEYRVGPSGRDIVRTARDMMKEVASPTPWPDRKVPQADGLPAPGWNPPPEDELARY